MPTGEPTEYGNAELKGYFETGDTPTQTQFERLIDAFQTTAITCSALKDRIGAFQGETVVTNGYYTKGDCESLLFRWDIDSTADDNGVDATHPGTIIQPTGHAGDGRWIGAVYNHLNARWFGAKGDGVQNDQPYLQAAIDDAINNQSHNEVHIPGGNYSIDSPLLAKKHNGDFIDQSFSLTITGDEVFTYDSSIAKLTTITTTFRDNFALGIQRGKGIRIKHLFFQGINTISFASVKAQYADDGSGFVTGGSRDNANSPYCAICIDPFGNDTVPDSGDRFPGFTDHYVAGQTGGGTTDYAITDCRIHSFVVGIIISPNGLTQNAEQWEVTRCRIDSVKVAIAPCELQNRSGRVNDITCWGNTHTLIDCQTYGPGSGQLPFFTGGNFAGGINQLFKTGASVQTAYVGQLFAESIYRIGNVSGTSVVFEACMFKFTWGDGETAPCIFSTTSPVLFSGCAFIHSANPPNSKPLTFFGQDYITFKNCTFDVPPLNGRFDGMLMRHDTSMFRHMWAPPGTGWQITSSGDVAAKNNDGLNRLVMLPGTTMRTGDLTIGNRATGWSLASLEGAITITITNGLVGSFTAADGSHYVAGDTIVFSHNITDDFGNSVNPTAVVSSVVSNTVNITNISPGLATGSWTPYLLWYSKYTEPCIGDTSSSTAIITNVKAVSALTSVFHVGQQIYGTGITEGTRITAIDNGAKTITVNKNCTATNTDVLIYDGIAGYGVTRHSWSAAEPTSGGWAAGTQIDDSTGATNGWRCTASGLFGSATEPTFATR